MESAECWAARRESASRPGLAVARACSAWARVEASSGVAAPYQSRMTRQFQRDVITPTSARCPRFGGTEAGVPCCPTTAEPPYAVPLRGAAAR